MGNIKILDCTLRDGGYCNEWRFGRKNAGKITRSLIEANIDIIECGFLTNRVNYDNETTKFTTAEQIASIIPQNRGGKMFVAMVNCGEYDPEALPEWDGSSIDGIRVAFHKKDIGAAIKLCEGIKEKGYKVFIQAMVSLTYSDEEFLGLIRSVNLLSPYAFYIVDSFGSMKQKDLMRMFYLVAHNLNRDILVGFHSHNNMQLSYSNAQALVEVRTERDLIIDASVYGMGRGAGNLNTELITDYLNEKMGAKYVIDPLLTIIDDVLSGFYQRNSWGFSLPNYLSAVHNVHPNYAGYLDDKKTLTVKEINDIFRLMDENEKVSFRKSYIEELYLQYMEKGKKQNGCIAEFKNRISGKKVLLIAPGKSSAVEKQKIMDFLKEENAVAISINFAYQHAPVDYLFVSNLRRFRDLDVKDHEKCIVTSNIGEDRAYLQIPYNELLTKVDAVEDNAGLMAIKFLMNLGVPEVYLAGFDGYSYDADANYASEKMVFITKNAMVDAMNRGMREVLKEYAKMVKIHFLTSRKFVVVE